jgi:ketosteroid isomerase-like protein
MILIELLPGRGERYSLPMGSERDEVIDQLQSREQIREVLHRYARGVDRCDRELLRSVYHPDATDIHGTVFVGNGQDFADWLIPWISRLPFNRHSVTNEIIELEGNRAFVESQYDATHRFPLQKGGVVDRRAQGRYLDVFERRDGEWRILHRRVTVDASWARRLSPEELAAPDPRRVGAHADLRPGHAPHDPVYRRFDIASVNGAPYRAPDPSEVQE